MNPSRPKRIKLYRWLKEHNLITLKTQVFLDLLLNRAVWEDNLGKTVRLVGWGDGHLQELLKEMEREGIVKSHREGRKIVYELTETSFF